MSTMGIDKGMLKGFLLILGIVAAIGGIFLSSYVWAIVGGSISQVATNGTTTTFTKVYGESFTVYNSTTAYTQFDHYPVSSGTLAIYNATSNVVVGLGNFTITYLNGSIALSPTLGNSMYNGTSLAANYTYSTTTGSSMPITSGAKTFLGTAETSFLGNLTTIQTAAGFAAALITVAVILLVFAGFIQPARNAYGQLKGGRREERESDLGY